MRAPRLEVLPSRPQTLWGWPAVLNFVLGGLGSGWYIVAVLAAGLERSPGVTAASWAAPFLVLGGFATVAGEAGRPLRGPWVLRRLWTSWMSRELLIGIAFVLLIVAELVFPLRLHRAQALVAATLLALAQGFILRAARGIPAWNVPIMPGLFLSSALLSGAGAYLLVESVAGRPPAPGVVVPVLGLVVIGFLAWIWYLRGSREFAFVQSVAPLRQWRSALVSEAGGHGLPVLLGLVALAAPAAAAPVLALAGALLIAGQAHAKAGLVRAAGRLRPITLAISLPGRRAS
ncbi:MAG TPA: NrfD/PsrC family molybdoenzyme membrane anchor subunit [Methylomirabilota bacterium]|nr:NrfD/PsrC family molybdoenzyme membrane anchor subunit [Methylomirabilota bacterium]